MDFGQFVRIPVANIKVDYSAQRRQYGLTVEVTSMPKDTVFVVHPDANHPSVQIEAAEEQRRAFLKFVVSSGQLFTMYIENSSTNEVPYVVTGIIVDPGSTLLFSKNPTDHNSQTNQDLEVSWKWRIGSYFK